MAELDNWDQLQRSFENKLKEIQKSMGAPPKMADALIHVNDTMEAVWRSARYVFGNRATPEVAITMYALVEAERLKLINEELELLNINQEDQG